MQDSGCGHPGCENTAEFQCVVCRRNYCAFHIYQQGGYVCKTHFNEPVFVDPHAPKPQVDLGRIEEFIDRMLTRLKIR